MEQPGIWTRVLAFVKGEVNTNLLEAFRRAGATIHEQLDRAEKTRFELKADGQNAWTADTAAQLELLCTWNAFALQTLGDEFLDSDYAADPSTVGFVPKITAEQSQSFYDQVERWLSRARQAGSNSSYQIDVDLPATLPPWSEVEPCPRPHLEALMGALKAIRPRLEALFANFEKDGTPTEHQKTLEYLRQLLAEANTKADYVDRLYQPKASQELHERIEEHVQKALEIYYTIGQCLAMPELAKHPKSSKSPHLAPPSKLPALPNQPGFDMWIMTDPNAVNTLKRDARAVIVMKEMWHYNPDPKKTLEIWTEIENARKRGDIDYAHYPNGSRVGHYFCTPWAPIYVAKRPIKIAGERLGTSQQFAFEAAAEGVLVGEEFKLEIVKGNFKPSELDYCDPREPSPHDD